MGLSPRVRGNLETVALDPQVGGSIPASAGEPVRPPHKGGLPRVYPRECGGTTENASSAKYATGLSPRVRGNPRPRRRGAPQRGSIPASAGEPDGSGTMSSLAKVYPRECGGTQAGVARTELLRGLSPRVRGNRTGLPLTVTGIGSIPASAGEPSGRSWTTSTSRVYPRECGGTSLMWPLRRTLAGLSPRVRGNLFGPRYQLRWNGSIPASAGEPALLASRLRRAGVYPRECGGTCRDRFEAIGEKGLSPRVRGNHGCELAVAVRVGSIPASAGEPACRSAT